MLILFIFILFEKQDRRGDKEGEKDLSDHSPDVPNKQNRVRTNRGRSQELSLDPCERHKRWSHCPLPPRAHIRKLDLASELGFELRHDDVECA